MNAVFADAGYWIALFNPRDRLHATAIAVSQAVQDRPIVTSQVEIMLQTAVQFEAALTLYAQRQDNQSGV